MMTVFATQPVTMVTNRLGGDEGLGAGFATPPGPGSVCLPPVHWVNTRRGPGTGGWIYIPPPGWHH